MIASTLAFIARRNASLKRFAAKLRDARADHHALREMAYRDAAAADRAQAESLCAGADTFAPIKPKLPKPTRQKVLPPPPAPKVAPDAAENARRIHAVFSAGPNKPAMGGGE